MNNYRSNWHFDLLHDIKYLQFLSYDSLNEFGLSRAWDYKESKGLYSHPINPATESRHAWRAKISDRGDKPSITKQKKNLLPTSTSSSERTASNWSNMVSHVCASFSINTPANWASSFWEAEWKHYHHFNFMSQLFFAFSSASAVRTKLICLLKENRVHVRTVPLIS